MPDPTMPDRSRNPRARSLALAVATLLCGLAFVTIAPAAPADAACGATGTKVITGAFVGEDGRSVSGFVGLSVFNSAGQNIGIDGCPIVLGGYGPFTDSVNPHPSNPGCCFALPTEGQASGGDRTWSITVPNNASHVWVEAYPKSSTPNSQGLAHQTDYRRYGGALRRGVPATSGAHLDIRLPRNCASGGAGPTLVGTATRNGQPATIRSVNAFSVAAEGTGQILGFVTTPIAVNGPTFTLPSLAANQSYALEISTTDGGHWWFEHNYGTGVPVRSCAGSPVHASFELPGSGGNAVLTGLSGVLGSGPGAASTGSATNQLFFRGFDGALWTQTEGSPAYRLDGQILGEPDAVLSANGRLDIVARGIDNRIYWRNFVNGRNPAWSPWVSLGGGTGFAPAITSWSPGRLDVAATGLDGQLWLRSSADGGASWFPWTPFGGMLSAGPDITSWGPNRLDVAARGRDGAVWHRAWSFGWQPWESMGGYTVGGPAAASYQPGVLEVVARGGDNRVYLAGWHANGYRTWTPLGGGLTDADPELVATPGSTRLSVYARGLDGVIWRTARVSPNVPFGGWQSVGP